MRWAALLFLLFASEARAQHPLGKLEAPEPPKPPEVVNIIKLPEKSSTPGVPPNQLPRLIVADPVTGLMILQQGSTVYSISLSNVFTSAMTGTSSNFTGAPNFIAKYNGLGLSIEPSVLLQSVVNGVTNITDLGTLIVNGLILSTNSGNGPLNVKAFGAKGDGTNDDTVPIQNAINMAIATTNSVFSPSGTYMVNGLTVSGPGIQQIFGEGKTGTKSPRQVGSRWMLRNGANAPLLTFADNAYADITYMAFDGNKTNQTVTAPLIYIAPSTYQYGDQNPMKIESCQFINANGDGLQISRREVVLHKVMSLYNYGNGIYFMDGAGDCEARDTQAGHNWGDGFRFVGNTGNFRSFNCDSYGNRGFGQYIQGPVGDDYFYGWTINDNWKSAVWLTNVVARMHWHKMLSVRNNRDVDFIGNASPFPSGTFPDVLIGDSAYTTDLEFDFPSIASSTAGTKVTSYAIYDGRGWSNGVFNPLSPLATAGLTNGNGIHINGGFVPQYNVGAFLNTNGYPFFPKTFCPNGISPVDGQGSTPYPVRLTQGSPAHIGAALVMDGQNTNTTIYQPSTNGGFAIQNNGRYFVFDPLSGLITMPSDVTIGGSVTNYIRRVLYDGSASNYASMDYPLPGGGRGVQVGSGTNTNTFSRVYQLGTNGVLITPNGVQGFSSDHSPTSNEIGAGGWLLFQSGSNLVARMVQTNGTTVVDTPLAQSFGPLGAYNVHVYGARGDGINDDTVAIQNALNAATSNLLVFPYGVYKVTAGLTLQQGQKIDFMGSTITNTSTNFTFTFISPKDGLDNYGPFRFHNGIIRAKNGFRINDDTDINPQEPLMGWHFDKMQVFGSYGAAFDPNYGSAIMPSDSELQGYGIGIKANKMVDANVDQCLFSGCGVGIWMMGCDVSKIHKATRFQVNANHIRCYGTNYWGGQVLMADLDCIQNARVGGIYIATNFNWRVERCFLECNLGSATVLYETNTFGGSFVDNNVPNTGQTNTPILAFGPRFGLLVAHNHFTASSPLGYFNVSPGSQWTPSNPGLGEWADNQAEMPLPIGAGLFSSPQKPYIFCSTNYESLGGNATGTAWPWRIDPFTKRWTITTNNPTFITQMHLASPSDQAFFISVSGRRTTNSAQSGYILITYWENGVSSTLYSGDMFFSVGPQTNTDSRTTYVKLPQNSAGTGYLQFEVLNDQLALESIVATPDKRLGDPYLLCYTNYPNLLYFNAGATRNPPGAWVTDPYTGRSTLPTNQSTIMYTFPIQLPVQRNFVVEEVGRPATNGNGGYQIWTYKEGAFATTVYPGAGVGFSTTFRTNAEAHSFMLTVPSTNVGTGFWQVELVNQEVQYESIHLVPIVAPSSGYSTAVPTPMGILKIDQTPNGNGADATEDNLTSYTLPANSLANVGDTIEIDCYGAFAANTNNKTLKTYIFGTLTMQDGPSARNNINWHSHHYITRTTSTAVVAVSEYTPGAVVASVFPALGTDLTQPQIFKCTGQSASSAANDVTEKLQVIKWYKGQ